MRGPVRWWGGIWIVRESFGRCGILAGDLVTGKGERAVGVNFWRESAQLCGVWPVVLVGWGSMRRDVLSRALEMAQG